MSELAPTPQETDFHFVFCEHTVENADKIAEVLGDCDVVAFEMVGGDQAYRKSVADGLTLYAAETTSEAHRAKIESQVKGTDLELYVAVLKHFPASNKVVVPIDASDEDAVYPSVQKTQATNEAYADMIRESAPVSTISEALTSNVALYAESNKLRESLVIQQLSELAKDRPGARIGVVMGAIHTPVHHELSKAFHTTRSFVQTGALQPGEKYKYSLRNEAARTVRLGGSDEVGRLALQAQLLQHLHLFQIGQKLNPADLRKLNPETIKARLQALDQVHTQKRQALASITELPNDMVK